MRTLETICEYKDTIKLDRMKSARFVIPAEIIMDKDMNDKRCTAFSYMSMRRGLDNDILYTVNDMTEWTGRTPNRHKNGINSKFIESINELSDRGYIHTLCEPNHTSLSKASIDMDMISRQCNENRFASVYLDEIDKIMKYENPNPKDSFFNKDIVLLVFSYLRMMIPRRKNILLYDENGDIDFRSERYPEAYDCYQNDIADELGISQKSISKAINALKEMNLIYHEELPRIQSDGKWKTQTTIFCNFYKREGNELLADGKEYYMNEIKNKKKKLDKLKRAS